MTTHLHLYDPSTASSLVPISLLLIHNLCQYPATYIFKNGLSLPVHFLLCLNLNAVAELGLFQHQTRLLLLLWLLLLVNFVRCLRSCSLHRLLLVTLDSISWWYKSKGIRTGCRWWLHILPRFLWQSFLWMLGVFIFPTSRRILSSNCSVWYTLKFLVLCGIAFAWSIH